MSRLPLDVPQPYAHALEAACADDRTFFDTQPGAHYRVRPIVAGEFWPYRYPPAAWVLVLPLWDGVRLRQALADELAPYDTDAAALADEHRPVLPPCVCRRRA